MVGPDPAVADIRRALNRCWQSAPVQALMATGSAAEASGSGNSAVEGNEAKVAVACSGGADSMALLAAVLWQFRRETRPITALIVDHGWHSDSARISAEVAARVSELGAIPVVLPVDPAIADRGGPEGLARAQRYQAISDYADEHNIAVVFLGHTQRDQAENVFLGLMRGSGATSLSGMAVQRERYVRPFLALPADVTRKACQALGIQVWEDPANADPRFLRVRVRRQLSELEADWGPGLVASLARTADLLREDDQALTQWSASVMSQASDQTKKLDCARLTTLPGAVISRVVRGWLLEHGVPGGALTQMHIHSVRALVTEYRGQGPISLPGGGSVLRECGKLTYRATD